MKLWLPSREKRDCAALAPCRVDPLCLCRVGRKFGRMPTEFLHFIEYHEFKTGIDTAAKVTVITDKGRVALAQRAQKELSLVVARTNGVGHRSASTL